MTSLNILDDTRKLLRKVKGLNIERYYGYLTFNKAWTDKNTNNKFENIQVEKFLKKLKIKVRFGKVECAVYIHDEDKIIMPYKRHFRKINELSKEQNYYSTLFHEIMHWSGASQRMNRKSLLNDNESENEYFLEELIAEIGSVYLLRYFEICDVFPELSLVYIKTNLLEIPEDVQKHYFVRAHSRARDAVNYLIERFEKTRKKS